MNIAMTTHATANAESNAEIRDAGHLGVLIPESYGGFGFAEHVLGLPRSY